MRKREYIFERIVDFHIAGIRLAQKDARKGDLEAVQFLQEISNISVNGSGKNGRQQQQQTASGKPSR